LLALLVDNQLIAQRRDILWLLSEIGGGESVDPILRYDLGISSIDLKAVSPGEQFLGSSDNKDYYQTDKKKKPCYFHLTGVLLRKVSTKMSGHRDKIETIRHDFSQWKYIR